MARSRKITDKLLDFWLENRLNVMFVGRHGVGKTAMIKDCFERNGLKWKYFSAATMDPWCDFVGIPRVIEDDKGKHLEYVLPQDLNDDSVEALFFDEFNRSHKKIQNAVMELIQFKSINGRMFNNLKVVWIAINPHDEDSDEYHVEKMDAALEDRFHIKVDVPFEPNIKFFRSTYGVDGKNAVEWWKGLESKVRANISPRRLEYALKVLLSKGDTSYVFGNGVNVTQFEEAIRIGDIKSIIAELVKENNEGKTKKWIKSPNNLSGLQGYLKRSRGKRKSELVEFFAPFIPAPQLTSMMLSDDVVRKFVLDNEKVDDRYGSILDSLLESHIGKTLDKNSESVLKEIAVKRQTSSDKKKSSAQVKYLVEYTLSDALNTMNNWNSTTDGRFKSLDESVSLVENFPKLFSSDASLRRKFMDVIYGMSRRSNYSSYTTKRRLPSWERVVAVINKNWPLSERKLIHINSILDRNPKTKIDQTTEVSV